ncbi:MAG: YcxB family protein [Pyrinomonadaceae bacterium]
MNREIEVRYTRELIKFAVRKFWTRSIGVGGFVSFGIVFAAFIYFLLTSDRSWTLGFLGSVVGLGLVIGIVSYLTYLNRSLEKFKRMDEPTATFRFTDERIAMESNIGWTELSWTMIDKIWKYPSVWLVFIARQGYLTLPTADLDDELKQFITSKVEDKET